MFFDSYTAELRQMLDKMQDVKILPTALGYEAALMGAVAIVL